MITIHSSKIHHAMACPGYMYFEDLPEDVPGEPARQGTAAGEYLERLLVGREIGTHATNGIAYTDEMDENAKYTARDITARAESEVLCEGRADWTMRSGVMVRGKFDASYTSKGGRVLHVDDYKYGWGLVEVEGNWQLLTYAIGEMLRRGQSFDEYSLRILQPRPHHEDGKFREWRISHKELLQYKEEIEARFDYILEGGGKLNTGSHCRYCKANTSCPAFNKSFYETVQKSQDFIQDDLTTEEISKQLDLIDEMETVFKIRKDSLEKLANHRIRNGGVVPNYVTQEKFGRRKWHGHISPELVKMLCGVDVSKVEMLSPAQAEKCGVPTELVKKLAGAPSNGTELKKKDTSKMGDKIFGKGDPTK